MFVVNLLDVTDSKEKYGVLICNNDDITEDAIQNKIYEIKEEIENQDQEWVVEDIIKMFPKEWMIELQHQSKWVNI